MSKRSAFTLAAGVAAALLVGAIAISLMSSGVSHARTDGRAKPIVRHRVHTVTIHRKAQDPSPSGVQVVHLPSGRTSPAISSVAAAGSDGYESESEGSGSDDGSTGSHEIEAAGDD